jgi:hypothetical protein
MLDITSFHHLVERFYMACVAHLYMDFYRGLSAAESWSRVRAFGLRAVWLSLVVCGFGCVSAERDFGASHCKL